MPSNASRSRRHSQSSSGKSEGRAYALPRRATVTSLAPVAHLRRTGSQYNVTTSAPFQPNQLVHLPFQTTPPSESHSVRRYGIIEVEQLQDAKTKSFEDVPLALEQRRKSLEAVYSQQPREQHKSYMGYVFRLDYILGDTVRSPSHMIVEDCPEAALHKASQLKLHDFAFIKRSDGSWTYAILACTYRSEVDNEECMMFVMNESGYTKCVKKTQWASFIRGVVVEAEEIQETEAFANQSVPNSISVHHGRDDCSMISFNPGF